MQKLDEFSLFRVLHAVLNREVVELQRSGKLSAEFENKFVQMLSCLVGRLCYSCWFQNSRTHGISVLSPRMYAADKASCNALRPSQWVTMSHVDESEKHQ